MHLLCRIGRDGDLGTWELGREVVRESARRVDESIADDELGCTVGLRDGFGEEVVGHLGSHPPEPDEANALLPLRSRDNGLK